MTTDEHDDLLTGRTFQVRAVDGTAALEVPTAVLTFGTDGRITGRATINRVNGPFRVEVDELVCGPLISTMMAGAPEAMTQERRLMTALASAPRVRAGADGEIELVTADGVTRLLEVDDEDGLA